MVQHLPLPVILLALLLLTSGCSSPISGSETRIATCTVALQSLDGAENARVNDYVADLGRGVLVHLDTIDESAEEGSVTAVSGATNPTFTGNRKDARIHSIRGGLLELEILDAGTATYLANSNLCRP